MSNPTRFRSGLWIVGAPLLLLFAALRPTSLSQPQQAAPPAAVQSQSFSVTSASATTTTGVHPADILGIGGAPLIACEQLGLLCVDAGGTKDDLVALSFGDDFQATDLPPIQFSVDGAAQGLANTAVRGEASCTPAQPQADIFETALTGGNSQDLDGDGAACAGGAGYGLSLAEGANSDDIDALAGDPCQTVDLNCDGQPEAPIYLTLAADSPSLDLIDATPADLLTTANGYTLAIWATAAELGLVAGDAIDGLCLGEDGDGLFGAADQLLFSLAPGSPTLDRLGATPGDLLLPARGLAAVRSASLGLAAEDNVDALACTQAPLLSDLYLPLIER
jgi:hypothetical protein